MSREGLLPCPFCGGSVEENDTAVMGFNAAFFECLRCGAKVSFDNGDTFAASHDRKLAGEAARMHFNRRSGRTCRAVVSHGDHGAEPRFEGDAWTMWHCCSECGRPIDPSDAYCRHCGAEVAR